MCGVDTRCGVRCRVVVGEHGSSDDVFFPTGNAEIVLEICCTTTRATLFTGTIQARQSTTLLRTKHGPLMADMVPLLD